MAASVALDGSLSERGRANVDAIMPKIKGAVEQRKQTVTDAIDLSTSENWLIRPELVELCKEAISRDLEPKHLSYPRGFSGDPTLLDAYAALFNANFAPQTPVLPSHLATAPGAAAAIDALLYNTCDAGDGVLVPGPYWNGFDFSMRVRSAAEPVLVSVDTFDANFTDSLIPALEEAYTAATRPIKALMITNPHNPLGVCYPRRTLEQCLCFCQKHRLHFISDEVYALSQFDSPDLPDPEPFTSVLSLDLDALGVDKSLVHMVWSTSKDFGQSGFRMGCTVTQHNEELAVGLALAANTQISALSTIFVTALLTSARLPSLISLNATRLSRAYTSLTSFFRKHGIPYMPCNAGLYVFAKLAPSAKTWEDEDAMVGKLKDAGVLVSAGKAYHGPEGEKGWMRVGFAIDEEDLKEAMQRIGHVLATRNGVRTKRALTEDEPILGDGHRAKSIRVQ